MYHFKWFPLLQTIASAIHQSFNVKVYSVYQHLYFVMTKKIAMMGVIKDIVVSFDYSKASFIYMQVLYDNHNYVAPIC